MTVPPVETALLNQYQDLIYPITSPMFVIWSKQGMDIKLDFLGGFPLWAFVCCIGIVVSLILLVTVKKRDFKPRPRYVSSAYFPYF
jgi:hypothetical protein